MKTRIISKGNHYCNIELPYYRINPREVSLLVEFTKDLYYCPCKLPLKDRLDVNKLWGLTWSHNPRLLSARFGFVNSEEENVILLYSFVHHLDEDKWDSVFLKKINVSQTKNVLLTIRAIYEYNSICFDVDELCVYKQYFDFSKAHWLVRELRFYHGGDNPAPKTIKYRFQRVNPLTNYNMKNQTYRPNFWETSIKKYPIFFIFVFILAPLIYFGPDGIKDVRLHNKGTIWPFVFSLIMLGFIVSGIVWFYLNHRKAIKNWDKENHNDIITG